MLSSGVFNVSDNFSDIGPETHNQIPGEFQAMEAKYQRTSDVARGGNSGYLTPPKVRSVPPLCAVIPGWFCIECLLLFFSLFDAYFVSLLDAYVYSSGEFPDDECSL